MAESQLRDLAPSAATFLDEVTAGLSAVPRSLPYQYLYDDLGAILFEAITVLDEYYPTRTELGIMAEHAAAMAAALGPRVRLVEPGSGSLTKVRYLLDHLEDVRDFVPIDIAREQLEQETVIFARQFPAIPIHPVCADFTRDLVLPELEADTDRVCVYYPGSTIGNFPPAAARDFLARMGGWVRGRDGTRDGALLIGVDLKKDPAILLPAYDDRRGVTAAFIRNLLSRINSELGGDFDERAFAYRAVYEPSPSRVSMQLVSELAQTVTISGREFAFDQGEVVEVEYSHKPSLDEFAALAEAADLRVVQVWTDPQQLFSVQLLEPVG